MFFVPIRPCFSETESISASKMPSNKKQRDLKTSTVIVGAGISGNSEFLSGGTYIKRDKPGNVQSMHFYSFHQLCLSAHILYKIAIRFKYFTVQGSCKFKLLKITYSFIKIYKILSIMFTLKTVLVQLYSVTVLNFLSSDRQFF